MKVAIIGSRLFSNLGRVAAFVQSLPLDTVVVSGGASGVDCAAFVEANRRGLKIEEHKPDWRRHGRAAGFIRNHAIVNAADEVVAFWDGRSKGTRHSINLAREAGKKVTVFTEQGATL